MISKSRTRFQQVSVPLLQIQECSYIASFLFRCFKNLEWEEGLILSMQSIDMLIMVLVSVLLAFYKYPNAVPS